MADEPITIERALADESGSLRVTSDHERPLSALCISGGGIRSATFGLGAIQGLAERGLLEQFDYLSTVSGGGYIGGWLTAWKDRAGGLQKVVPRLRRDALPPAPGEPDPIQHLRDYNSYLSPRSGVVSSDLWTLIATIIRNILLNWLVLIPLLMVGLMVPRLFLSALAFPDLFFSRSIFAAGPPGNYSVPALDVISSNLLIVWVLPLSSGALLTCALFFILRYLPGVGDADPSRFDYLRRVLIPLVGAAMTFMAFDSLYYLGSHYIERGQPWRVMAWTLAASGAAWLLNALALRVTLRAPSRPARTGALFGTTSIAVVCMAAGTGLATWIATDEVLFSPEPKTYLSWAAYVTVGLPAILLGFCAGTVILVGFSSFALADDDREWLARAVAEVMLVAACWLAICTASLVFPRWVLSWHTWMHGVLSAAAAAAAWLSTRGGPVPANAGSVPSNAAPKAPLPLSLATRVAPTLFLVLLAVGLSILTNVLLWALHWVTGIPLVSAAGLPIGWQDHYGILERSHPALVGLLALTFVALSAVSSRYININTFSLHGMYRDRLVRAYLGASNPRRTVSRFTGFARNDDLAMADLDTGLKPLHVVNLTLNVVATSRLAWQQRKAESFTVTAFHCGNESLGFRPSTEAMELDRSAPEA